jgi:hypothetical protein
MVKKSLKAILILSLFLLNTNLNAQKEPGRKFTDNQWYSDLDSMISFMLETHPDLLSKTPEQIFTNEINQLKTSIHELTDYEIITRFNKLVSLANDGHSLFMGSNLSDKYFPVRIEPFSDGYYVTSVSKEFAGIYRARVTKIGKFNSDKAFEIISSVTSGDNYYSKLYWTTRNLTMSSILKGSGIIDSPDLLALEIVDKTNTLQTISLKANEYPFEEDPFHLWFWQKNAVPATNYINLLTESTVNPPQRLKNSMKPYWFEYIRENKTLYFCFNSCENDTDKPFNDFIKSLWQTVDTEKPEKLIIDLRNNLGGTNSYLQPLIHGIICHNEINKRGHLFVMTSRKTFSAAMHCATWIERNAQPIFVGEPTGAGSNHCADPNLYILPNSKLMLMVSTTYWQNGWPWDKREWIEPEIRFDVTSQEYFDGKDKALDSILVYKSNKE